MTKAKVVIEYGNNYIYLDAVEPHETSISSQITSYPVTSGDLIGEHIIRDPIDINIRGSFSENGSNETLINGRKPDLKEFERYFETIRNNAYNCSIYKIQQDKNTSKFLKRNNCVLKRAVWVEDVNSLTYSFSFQQILAPTSYSNVYSSDMAENSTYQTFSAGSKAGTYDASTGTYTDGDRVIAASSESSKVCNEDGYTEIEIIGETLSRPNNVNVIETKMPSEAILAIVIEILRSEGFVDDTFLDATSKNSNIKIAGIAGAVTGALIIAVGGGAIAGTLGATGAFATLATTLVGTGVIPGIGWIAAGIGLLIAAGIGIYYAFNQQSDVDDKKFKFKSFTKDDLSEERQEEFVSFLNDVYNEILLLNDKFTCYSFSSFDNAIYDITDENGVNIELTFTTRKKNLGEGDIIDVCRNVKIVPQLPSMTFGNAANFATYLSDLDKIAKTSYLDAGTGDFMYLSADGRPYFGYFMKTEGISNNIDLIISSMTPKVFSEQIAKVVRNGILRN